MKIIVTGANGFIGKEIISKLSQKYEIFAISRKPVNLVKDYCLIQDLFREETIETLKEFRPTHLIHTAAIAHKQTLFPKINKKEFLKINIDLTRKLYKLSDKLNVKKFIFFSSISFQVKNGFSSEVISEKSKIYFESLYSYSKYKSEEEIKNLSKKLNTKFICLRPTVVYGKNPPGNFGKLSFLLKSRFYLPLNNISNKRSILSIINLVSLTEECCLNEKADNETFVISDDEIISTTSLVKKITRYANLNEKIFTLPIIFFNFLSIFPFIKKPINILTKDLIVDSSYVREKLSWQQPVSQDKALKDAFGKKQKLIL